MFHPFLLIENLNKKVNAYMAKNFLEVFYCVAERIACVKFKLMEKN